MTGTFGEVEYTEDVRVTLRYEDKEYSYAQTFEKFGHSEWSPFELAQYQYEDGNYSCDCNKSRFLSRQCGVGREELEQELEPGDNIDDFDWVLECGETIELVSLELVQGSRKPVVVEGTASTPVLLLEGEVSNDGQRTS